MLIENFRPGTLERWGLAPETLWETNPRLVVTRVTGFGQTGPYAARAGYGSIGEAMGGIRYVTGDPDRPPARAGISLGDSLAATFACLGTLVACTSARRTGRGQVVDSAIYEAVLAHDGVAAARVAGRRLPARAHRHHAAQRLAQQRLPDRPTARWCSSPPTRTRCSAGWPT